MKKQSVVGDKYVTITFISWGLILFGLYLTSLYSYLLFHSVAEIFSIVVACGIFMLAWNSRRFLDNTYLLFIGIAYLFIGGLDLIHTLAYQGMGVFQGYGTNLPTQLWISSRYVESLSLLIAPLFLGRKLKTNFLFLGYGLAVCLLLGSIFYWNLFPVCFIEGVGLTLFKKVSEYIISLILFVSIAMLFKKRREFDTSVLRLLIASIILTIVSELAFTFYVHAYGLSNLIGHYLKIVSFYLIYKAIIETGLANPYALLFRNLKQSEEALLAEKQFTDDVIEALTDTFYIFDPEDGKGLRWNKVLEEMSGYNYNDIRHYPPTHFYPPEEHQRIEEATKTIREKKSATFELTYITKDGRRIPFEYSAVLIKSPEGKPWICAIGRDITERKRAEAQIIRTKQEWERTFDAVPDLIMILDNEYRVVRVNKAMAERLSCSPKDLLGQTCYDAFHGIEKPLAHCPHARLMVDGLSHTADVHEDRLGGDFLVSVNPLHGADGKLTGSVHVARDITERKQAEDALRESEKRYRDLYENAPNAYFSISAVDGSVLRCNSAALQLLGYDKETITKMRVLDLYADTPHGISKAKEILRRFQAGESIRDVELQMKRKDGQPIWISLTVEPLKDRDGNVIESRSMVINISERKQAEEALQKAHDELEQKVEERTAELKREIKERKQAEESLRESENHLRHLSSQLLTAQENERKRIALELHDGIGQSLSALKFGVENSLKQMDKGTARPIIKPLEAVIPIIQESIEEVRKIAMDLRPATLDDLGILATIGWFCREFQTIYGGIRIEKQINIEENEVPELQKTVIYRVMQEAMNNIAKHSKADLVRLSLRKTDSVIELVIEDNGLGFNFEEALSVESSRRGLGLSSMKERTELSGGSFAIQSVIGAGTTVRASWPL